MNHQAKDWTHPPAACRPLQIIHGFDKFPAGGRPAADALRAGLADLQRRGLGGVVCNVSFSDYLRSEPQWQLFLQGLDLCAELGLRVWIYDEEGYPSGAAGGRVLETDPSVEAEALVHDPAHSPPIYVRRAFEHTLAAQSWYACRRSPGLINARAVALFIELTHEAYRKRCGARFGKLVEAFFTDEPALMTVQLGEPPASIPKIPVLDRPDPAVKPLPGVPWVAELPDLYRKKYGEDLAARLPSLFGGDAAEDRRTRRRFWSLVADLMAERYFGRLQQWCESYGLASSGHALCEETPALHAPLMGNALECLRRMTIPGLDLLTSDPVDVRGLGWLCAVMPGSAAVQRGSRRVMTEVCDHIQRSWGKRPRVEPDEMCATAAWQAAFGVTEFTLYYQPALWTPEEYRRYCDTVGRLNAVLRDATICPRALLYYPIEDIQAGFIPTAGRFTMESQPERLQRTVASFIRLGQMLTLSQVPFIVADARYLSAAKRAGGTLKLGDRAYDGLLLPEGVELPGTEVLRAWDEQDRAVFRDRRDAPLAFRDLRARIAPAVELDPPTDWLVAGSFERAGRRIVLLANVGPAAYAGVVKTGLSRKWSKWFPDTGAIEPAGALSDTVPLALPPRSAVLLIGE